MPWYRSSPPLLVDLGEPEVLGAMSEDMAAADPLGVTGFPCVSKGGVSTCGGIPGLLSMDLPLVVAATCM